jgi:hypothetical protein
MGGSGVSLAAGVDGSAMVGARAGGLVVAVRRGGTARTRRIIRGGLGLSLSYAINQCLPCLRAGRWSMDPALGRSFHASFSLRHIDPSPLVPLHHLACWLTRAYRSYFSSRAAAGV